MASTALLVVSNVKQIGKTLHAIEKNIRALYIHLNIPSAVKTQPVPCWGRIISQLYMDSSNASERDLDLRILVQPLKQQSLNGMKLKPVDVIFSDSHLPELCESLRGQLNVKSPTIFLTEKTTSDIAEWQGSQQPQDEHTLYDTVVLGGTFDRIHLGHKIFLTQAVLRTCRRLVVGVTTEKLTKFKTLSELILPVEQRIRDVLDFLTEIDASIEYEVVAIDDPFGPTQHDPDMDMIVVSAETLRGGQKINEIRTQKGLRALEIFCIALVEDHDKNGPKEPKVSSSNTRIDLLGTRLRQPKPRPHLPTQPYIIGLTGGIASGKSKMAERFRNMGAVVLDCDCIAHVMYEPGRESYERIVQHFGKHILDERGYIDRTKLGPIVFADPKELDTLNGIVWPAILADVKRRICELQQAGTTTNQLQVVVIEAAVLLKAGWETECHEVWSMIIPQDEAVRRVMERNNLSEEAARQRVASQLENSELVAKSNVVFSSQWDHDFTQRQAEKAWQMLMRELSGDVRGKNSML